MIGISTEQIEKQLLGQLIIDGSPAYDVAAARLTAKDFMLAAHQRVYQAVGVLVLAGASLDVEAVCATLERSGDLGAVGGMPYVRDLTFDVPRGAQVESHVAIVKEASLRRSAARILATGLAMADNLTNPVEDVLGQAERDLLSLRARMGSADGTHVSRTSVARLDRWLAKRNRTSELLGFTTGLPGLDRRTRGLIPGEFFVVGAISGGGKSQLMAQAAVANARAGVGVLLVSLEMTEDQLLERVWSIVSGVPFPRVADPRLATDNERERVILAEQEVAGWPLHVVAPSSMEIGELTATARLLKRSEGVQLVGVDYVQRVRAEGPDERMRIKAISEGLTHLAKDEGLAVMALSQLARRDPGVRPSMSSLKESSQLEHDAHVIALIHREKDEATRKFHDEGEIIVDKCRSGEPGSIPIHFSRRTLTFKDATDAEHAAA